VLCQERYAKELNQKVFPGVQGGPLVHVIAAKAVCFREAAQPEFVEYQKQVVTNAQALAAELQRHGFRIVSGGTDNHLMLVDVFSKGITGKVAEKALEAAGIATNKNAIPFDTNPPLVASGIRLGTPALTTRGMKEDDMRTVAGLIAEVLDAPDSEEARRAVRQRVTELTERFPLYTKRLSPAGVA
jgi:glycine hydroxymethyltransferase